MELNIFMIKLEGGIGYSVESSCKDATELILRLAKSNVFSLEKTGVHPKYLIFDKIIEVQQVDSSETQRNSSWKLKEKK